MEGRDRLFLFAVDGYCFRRHRGEFMEFPSPLYIIIWIYKPVNQLLAYITG